MYLYNIMFHLMKKAYYDLDIPLTRLASRPG